MAKRALKPEIESKPKRVRNPNPDMVFKLTTMMGRQVWTSLQGDVIVTLPVEATGAALLKYDATGAPERRTRFVFEPWED